MRSLGWIVLNQQSHCIIAKLGSSLRAVVLKLPNAVTLDTGPPDSRSGGITDFFLLWVASSGFDMRVYA